MTTSRNKRPEIKRRLTINDRLRATALKAGPTRLFLLSLALSIGVGFLVHYYFLTPHNVVNDALSTQLEQKRRQNAIARMVQETKPQFLQEFRRVIENYATARELLPTEAEVSNVLESIQQMARANGVRVTMFDASKPGTKSTNPAATTSQAPVEGAPPQPQITLNERVIPAQIQGPHASVVRFLSAISKYPRIIYVRDFSITSLNKDETVNLTLVTYDAPTSGVLPPVPEELRHEYESANSAKLVSTNPR